MSPVSLQRPRARLLRLALVTSTVALGASSSAAAAGVEVVFDGETRVVDKGALAASADVPLLPYTVRAADGTTRTEPVGGTSVRTVIALAGGDPDVVSGVTIARGDGSQLSLSGPDLADPSPFAEGPALIWMRDGAVSFLRPVRDAADVNAADLVTTAPGASLTMTVQAGARLEVLAGADRDRVRAGGVVRFWASASGVDPGQRLRFRWHFDDGSEGEGQNVRHRFRGAGRYRVYVTVSSAGSAGGTSPVIPVEVGDPEADTTHTPSPPAAQGGGTGAAAGGAPSPRPAPRPAERQTARRRSAEPARKRKPAPAEPPAGDRVSGVLIDAPDAPARAAASRSAPTPRNASPGTGVPAEVWGGAVVFGLVGAGFTLERLPRRRWRLA